MSDTPTVGFEDVIGETHARSWSALCKLASQAAVFVCADFEALERLRWSGVDALINCGARTVLSLSQTIDSDMLEHITRDKPVVFVLSARIGNAEARVAKYAKQCSVAKQFDILSVCLGAPLDDRDCYSRIANAVEKEMADSGVKVPVNYRHTPLLPSPLGAFYMLDCETQVTQQLYHLFTSCGQTFDVDSWAIGSHARSVQRSLHQALAHRTLPHSAGSSERPKLSLLLVDRGIDRCRPFYPNSILDLTYCSVPSPASSMDLHLDLGRVNSKLSKHRIHGSLADTQVKAAGLAKSLISANIKGGNTSLKTVLVEHLKSNGMSDVDVKKVVGPGKIFKDPAHLLRTLSYMEEHGLSDAYLLQLGYAVCVGLEEQEQTFIQIQGLVKALARQAMEGQPWLPSLLSSLDASGKPRDELAPGMISPAQLCIALANVAAISLSQSEPSDLSDEDVALLQKSLLQACSARNMDAEACLQEIQHLLSLLGLYHDTNQHKEADADGAFKLPLTDSDGLYSPGVTQLCQAAFGHNPALLEKLHHETTAAKSTLEAGLGMLGGFVSSKRQPETRPDTNQTLLFCCVDEGFTLSECSTIEEFVSANHPEHVGLVLNQAIANGARQLKEACPLLMSL